MAYVSVAYKSTRSFGLLPGLSGRETGFNWFRGVAGCTIHSGNFLDNTSKVVTAGEQRGVRVELFNDR